MKVVLTVVFYQKTPQNTGRIIDRMVATIHKILPGKYILFIRRYRKNDPQNLIPLKYVDFNQLGDKSNIYYDL